MVQFAAAEAARPPAPMTRQSCASSTPRGPNSRAVRRRCGSASSASRQRTWRRSRRCARRCALGRILKPRPAVPARNRSSSRTRCCRPARSRTTPAPRCATRRSRCARRRRRAGRCGRSPHVRLRARQARGRGAAVRSRARCCRRRVAAAPGRVGARALSAGAAARGEDPLRGRRSGGGGEAVMFSRAARVRRCAARGRGSAAHTRSQSYSAWAVDGATLTGIFQVDARRVTQLSEQADAGKLGGLLAAHLRRYRHRCAAGRALRCAGTARAALGTGRGTRRDAVRVSRTDRADARHGRHRGVLRGLAQPRPLRARRAPRWTGTGSAGHGAVT